MTRQWLSWHLAKGLGQQGIVEGPGCTDRRRGGEGGKVLLGLRLLRIPLCRRQFSTHAPLSNSSCLLHPQQEGCPKPPSDSLLRVLRFSHSSCGISERLTVLALSFHNPLCLQVSNHSIILTSVQSVWK